MPVLTCSTWRASKASSFSLWISFLTLWGTSGTKKARNPAITMIRCYKRDRHMTVWWHGNEDCVRTSNTMINASRAVCSSQYLRLCTSSIPGLKPRNLCVCVCVRACVRVCVRACVCVEDTQDNSRRSSWTWTLVIHPLLTVKNPTVPARGILKANSPAPHLRSLISTAVRIISIVTVRVLSKVEDTIQVSSLEIIVFDVTIGTRKKVQSKFVYMLYIIIYYYKCYVSLDLWLMILCGLESRLGLHVYRDAQTAVSLYVCMCSTHAYSTCL